MQSVRSALFRAYQNRFAVQSLTMKLHANRGVKVDQITSTATLCTKQHNPVVLTRCPNATVHPLSSPSEQPQHFHPTWAYRRHNSTAATVVVRAASTDVSSSSHSNPASTVPSFSNTTHHTTDSASSHAAAQSSSSTNPSHQASSDAQTQPSSSSTHAQHTQPTNGSTSTQPSTSSSIPSPSPTLNPAATAIGRSLEYPSPIILRDIGFPYADHFNLGGKRVDCDTAWQQLQPFVFEGRAQRVQQVVANRTFTVLPVVEGSYDMGNLAAVCRTADALGYGAVHCVNTLGDRYKQSQRSAAGSDKWLDVKVWEGTRSFVEAVKGAGYQLVVTHLTQGSVPIQDIDWTRPTAFVLGNEKKGVSAEMVAAADVCAVIPMLGFVESFNISVAASLIMYEALQHRQKKLGRQGDLTEEQQRILQAAYLMRSVRESKTLLTELLYRPPRDWQVSQFKDSPKFRPEIINV